MLKVDASNKQKQQKIRKMKKFILAAILICATLPAFAAGLTRKGDVRTGNGMKKIEASKTIATQKFSLQTFSKLETNQIYEIVYKQDSSTKPTMTITGPTNVIGYVTKAIDKDKLKIGFAEGYTIKNMRGKKFTVTITGPALTEIDLKGVGDFRCDEMNTVKLAIDNDGVGNVVIKKITAKSISVDNGGVGNITLGGTSAYTELNCSGVGNINAKGLKSAVVKADCSGVGNIGAYAIKTAVTSEEGIGKINIQGTAKVTKK